MRGVERLVVAAEVPERVRPMFPDVAEDGAALHIVKTAADPLGDLGELQRVLRSPV